MITVKTVKIITIDDIDYPIIFEFPILWQGWELDDVGYIIVYGGAHRFIWSDHGEYKMISDKQSDPLCELSTSPHDIAILNNFIEKYKVAIEDTTRAINLLKIEPL